MVNQSVTIQFTILQNGTTNVYQEDHTTTTDANGIAIANIGEGTQISGVFNNIDWRKEQFLKVEINTGSGFEDFGTTAFKAVPYAKSAEKLLPTDKVIIGDTDTYATEKLYVKNANPDSELVDFRVGNLTAGKDVLNLYIDQNTSGSGSNNRSQFIEATRGSSLKFKVDDDGRVFSKTGYFTDGYVEAVGNITTYSNIKTWGNLEVDGEITSDLNMGDNSDLEMNNNEIHGTESGDADMKAYMYGSFISTPSTTILVNESTSGFTVSYQGVGKFRVHLPNNINVQDLTIFCNSIQGYSFSHAPTVLKIIYSSDVSSHYFDIWQYDLSGVYTNAGDCDTMGICPRINFVAYKK